ncbi:MAG: MotA/TolQ/ExbB proton channel family protein [Oligoflexales bacterium]
MRGKAAKKYLAYSKKGFDPIALGVCCIVIAAMAIAAKNSQAKDFLLDIKSLIIVVGGTFASLLFQFDIFSLIGSLGYVFQSILGTPDKYIQFILRQLDEAILNNMGMAELREGETLNGDILNDIVYMYRQGLLYEEIEAFVTNRISTEFISRQTAVTLLKKASIVAPSIGLFGTVLGLIGVLKGLTNPAMIGPSMSLALMTTAYGAGLGSVIFTPLAGRLEHHNVIFMEVHKQMMTKIGVLLTREERKTDSTNEPRLESA